MGLSGRCLVEELECIEGVAELRFVVVIVGSCSSSSSSSSTRSLFKGLRCKEFVIETGWYQMCLVAWIGCGCMFVESWCVFEFVGHKSVVIGSVGGMCLDMGWLKKKKAGIGIMMGRPQ